MDQTMASRYHDLRSWATLMLMEALREAAAEDLTDLVLDLSWAISVLRVERLAIPTSNDDTPLYLSS